MLVGGFAVAEALNGDRGDEELVAVHCPLCRETCERSKCGVHDVAGQVSTMY